MAFLAGYEPALLSAQSTAWRGKGADAGRAFTADLTTQIGDAVTSVRLVPRGQVTLSSRSGIIPLAVQNSLDQDVRIRVRVTATPSVRLRSSPTEVITVPAGRTASVDVAAEATADATFPVVAVLLTEEGTTIGQPVALQGSRDRLRAGGPHRRRGRARAAGRRRHPPRGTADPHGARRRGWDARPVTESRDGGVGPEQDPQAGA